MFFLAGILQESFVQPLLDPNYYSGITKEIDDQWRANHNNMNVSGSVKGFLVNYLGKPLVQLLRYGSICYTFFVSRSALSSHQRQKFKKQIPCLFNNRFQMTSKFGKNKKGGTQGAGKCVNCVLYDNI